MVKISDIGSLYVTNTDQICRIYCPFCLYNDPHRFGYRYYAPRFWRTPAPFRAWTFLHGDVGCHYVLFYGAGDAIHLRYPVGPVWAAADPSTGIPLVYH